MSEGSKLLATPRTDVLPGYQLSRATLADFAAFEEEIERKHITKSGAAAVGLPAEIRALIIGAATDDVANGRFKYGRIEFSRALLSTTSIPYLLFLLLRHCHPSLTRDMAEALITKENQWKVGRAVHEQFGYDKKEEGQPVNPPQAESIGNPSSPPSANEGSTTPPLAD